MLPSTIDLISKFDYLTKVVMKVLVNRNYIHSFGWIALVINSLFKYFTE